MGLPGFPAYMEAVLFLFFEVRVSGPEGLAGKPQHEQSV